MVLSATNHQESPPPKSPFWKDGQFAIPIAAKGTVTVQLGLDFRKRTFKHPSPVDAGKIYEEVMVRLFNRDLCEKNADLLDR